MSKYQTRSLVKAEPRKILLRKNVELKPEDCNDSMWMHSSKKLLCADNKKNYKSQTNVDVVNQAVKVKVDPSAKLSSINQEDAKYDGMTSQSAYNLLGNHSFTQIKSPTSIIKPP